MSRPTLILLRHAEKPAPGITGIDALGQPSPDSLTPRGWQRAGALVPYFLQPNAPVPTPATLFATSPDAPGADPSATSRRNEQTAQPLADRLHLPVCRDFGRGQEDALAHLLLHTPPPGPILLVWTHRRILHLARLLTANAPTVPATWPPHRYDITLLLTPTPTGYTLRQLPQLLLAGDSPDLLPL